MKILILFLMMILITSCGTDSVVYTNGEYRDVKEETLLNDRFNEADVQKITDTMVNSLHECSANHSKKRKVMLYPVKNLTDEHIDVSLIMNKIKTALIKSHSFRFVNGEMRDGIKDELSYQQDERSPVNKESRALANVQEAPDYFIDGSLHSNVQMVGKKKYVYYYITLNLTKIDTNMIECSEEKELKKMFQLESF